MDVWRKPQRFTELLLVCTADSRGRTGFEQIEYPQRNFLYALYQAALQVDIPQIIADGFQGQNIRFELNRRRIQAIRQKRAEIRPHFTNRT